MVGIYVRVSTEEQAKRGYSINDQIQECRKKAETDEIIEYIDEGISGEFLDRPGLTKLRSDVREGLITKVICLDPDRLSRKLMNQLIVTDEFDKKGVELIFVNGEYAKTPEGNLFYSMRGAIAEFEKAKITERMSRGRREKARQGKVVKNNHIYGYDYDSEKGQLVINEHEAEVVRLIFDLFTKPNNLVNGINGIAKYLTEKGVPTKRGAKVWHRQVVRQILMNSTYKGEFYQNRWNTEGMLGNKYKDPSERVPMRERPREEWIKVECPAIIDETTFEHAQKMLKESRRRWAKKSKHRYLLSGLLRCGDCGNTMTGRRAKNWGKYVYEYTDYKNYSGAQNRGCGRKIKAEDLDHFVWETIKGWLNNPNEIAVASERNQSGEQYSLEKEGIARLEKEIEKTRVGRKRLLKLFAEGLDISEEEIRQSLNDLKKQEVLLQKQLHELNESLKGMEQNFHSHKLLQEAAEYYLNKGERELTFDDKRELIRHIVREIRVHEDDVEIYTF